jgi:hypothetical protein
VKGNVKGNVNVDIKCKCHFPTCFPWFLSRT